jgi:hypothetical protein
MTEPKKKPTRGRKPATTPKKPVVKKSATPKKTNSAKSTPTTNKSPNTKKITSSTGKAATTKKTPTKPTSRKKKKTSRVRKPTLANQLKVPKDELKKFPYEMFPVRLFHMEGKEFSNLKICSFTDEFYALKYVERMGFKKTEYKMVKKK